MFMKLLKIHTSLLFVVLFLGIKVSANALDVSGFVAAEGRFFTEHSDNQVSLTFTPELYWQDESGDNSITLETFSRWDNTDKARTHNDIRELMWLHAERNWELHVGIGKVFWGVTESAHLVDIINQTDAVESPDGEDKLGQPMVQWTGVYDWGMVDAFVLPYFRERTFPGDNGFLTGGITVDENEAIYASDQEERHIDWALRYSHSVDVFDFGVSVFNGTNRDPSFIMQTDGAAAPRFIPFYSQITQIGIDAQATIDSFLWKLEAIVREDTIKDYAALTAGFEYTVVGVADSVMDLGFLTELHLDSRHDMATTPLQKDIFIGARLAFNDYQDSSLLMGISQDLDNNESYLFFIEADRRFGDNFRASIDGRLFQSDNAEDPIYAIKEDDHLTLSVEYYF